jgi:hypothetical protein
MANRITDAFARMKAQIADRIAKGLTTAERVRDLHQTLDMDLTEYVKFQTLKTLAVASGLTLSASGKAASRQGKANVPIHARGSVWSNTTPLIGGCQQSGWQPSKGQR